MLRTTGSSLIAKASPGGAFRKVDETRIESPALPGKGEIGSVSRGMLEEPIERQVPPGSTKSVSSSPSVEPTAVAPTGMLPSQPWAPEQGAPGIGLPTSTPMRGVNGATPDVGLMQPTLRSQAAGAAGKAVSGGALPGAQAATMYQPQPSTPVGIQGEASPTNTPMVNPWVSVLGGKTYAEGQPNPTFIRPTTGQELAGAAGKALTAVGSAFRAPQLTPGGLGAQLQTWGGAPTIAQQGIGSAGNALRSVAQAVTNNLRSGGAIGQAASKVSSWLRSLFGK